MREPCRSSIIATMDDCGPLHRIEDDLAESWVSDWAEDGLDELERYLAKHLAFLTFLDDAA